MQTSRLFRYSGLLLLCAVLAIGPFLRGLFFWTELLVGITLTAAGFGLWAWGRRRDNLPFSITGGVPGLALLALLTLGLKTFLEWKQAREYALAQVSLPPEPSEADTRVLARAVDSSSSNPL